MALKSAKLLIRPACFLCMGLLCFWLLSLLWQRVLASRPTVLSIRTEPPGAEVVISPPDDPSMRSVGKAPVRLQLPRREANRNGVWSLLVRQPGYWPLMVKLPAEAMRGRTKTVDMRLGRFTLESVGALPVVYEPHHPKRKGDSWRIGRLDGKRLPRELRVPRCGHRWDQVELTWCPGGEGVLVWSVVHRPPVKVEPVQDFLDELCEDSPTWFPLLDGRYRYMFAMTWQDGRHSQSVLRCQIPGNDDGYDTDLSIGPDGEWIVTDGIVEDDKQVVTSLATGEHRYLTCQTGGYSRDNTTVSPDGATMSYVRRSYDNKGTWSSEWVMRNLQPDNAKEREIMRSVDCGCAAFSPDSKWIAAVERGKMDKKTYEHPHLLLLSKEGQRPGQRYEIPPLDCAQWSFDGKWLALSDSVETAGIAYWGDAQPDTGFEFDTYDTMLVRIQNGRVLGSVSVRGGFAGWLPDNEHFLIRDWADDTVSVVGLDRRVALRFGAPAIQFFSPEFNPSGRRIAALGESTNGHTWLYLFDPSHTNKPRRLRIPKGSIGRFDWEDDDHVWLSKRGSANQKWRLNVISEECTRVLHAPPLQPRPKAFSDKKWLALFRRADVEVLRTHEKIYRSAVWSAKGRYAVLSRNGHLWLYNGDIHHLPDIRVRLRLHCITHHGDRCFPNAAVAPTIPPKVRQTRSGWIVQPDI